MSISGPGLSGIPLSVDSSGDLIYTYNGVSQIIGAATPIVTTKSYSFQSPTGGFGTYYVGGFYRLVAADLNLTQASATGTAGSANISYAAHAILVAGGVGAVSGGTTGTATITVSGTSITDAGVRTAGDSEVLITDVTASAQMAANTYHETTKKWIGQVTYTLAQTGDRTTYNADFNVGLAKYEDFGNRDFTIDKFEVVGLGGAADTGFNVELVKHIGTNWTYHATAFVAPTANSIASMNTVHNTEINLASGGPFAFKRTGLASSITGTLNVPTATTPNGVLVKITTGANGSVEDLDAHIGITFD